MRKRNGYFGEAVDSVRGLLVLIGCVALAAGAFAAEALEWAPENLCGDVTASPVAAGSWLEGGWGIRVVIPAGDDARQVERFRTGTLLQQLKAIKTARWVMLNLTAPSFGGLFTSPGAVFEQPTQGTTASRFDLLGLYIDQLRRDGYKIMLYVASQGPSLNFLSTARVSRMKRQQPKFYGDLVAAENAWKAYLERSRLSADEAYGQIIATFSQRFGNKVDAWWFDHGNHGNPARYIRAAKSGNPEALVAWAGNRRVYRRQRGSAPIWLLGRSTLLADFTDGHVSPTLKDGGGHVPWWPENEWLVDQVEQCFRVSGAIPHIFSPLQSTWQSGDRVFPTRTAVDWTRRVIASGGGITWAAALRAPNYQYAAIADDVFKRLKQIDAAMAGSGFRR